MERERATHQIDDFESWEEIHRQQRSPLANSPSPLVACPVCSSWSLTETPRDGIRCANPDGCAFRLDTARDGLTLAHLRDRLRAIYEEHSGACPGGTLRFRVEGRAGAGVLMARCDACSSDAVVL